MISGAIGEYDYDFLTYCQERMHNLDSLESDGVVYTIYHLTDMASK